jgi:hypothetical protein
MCDLYDWPALANSRGNEGQSPFHREVQDSERCSSCRSTRVFASAPKKVSGGKRVNHEAEVKCAGFAGAETWSALPRWPVSAQPEARGQGWPGAGWGRRARPGGLGKARCNKRMVGEGGTLNAPRGGWSIFEGGRPTSSWKLFDDVLHAREHHRWSGDHVEGTHSSWRQQAYMAVLQVCGGNRSNPNSNRGAKPAARQHTARHAHSLIRTCQPRLKLALGRQLESKPQLVWQLPAAHLKRHLHKQGRSMKVGRAHRHMPNHGQMARFWST